MQRCFFIFCTKCRKDHNDGKRKKRMRKTLKRNLSYDDRNHTFTMSRSTTTAKTAGACAARAPIPRWSRPSRSSPSTAAQLLGGMSAPRGVFCGRIGLVIRSNDCIATGKGGGSRTLNITPRATSPSTRRKHQPDAFQTARIAQFIAAQRASFGRSPLRRPRHSLRASPLEPERIVPMFSISKALGHSSTSVTSAVYMHLFDDAVADVISQVASTITGAEP